jgi:hypothetical protein
VCWVACAAAVAGSHEGRCMAFLLMVAALVTWSLCILTYQKELHEWDSDGDESLQDACCNADFLQPSHGFCLLCRSCRHGDCSQPVS